ncbi:MAG: copper chaperone PCu(A)C, partial [Anaerolineae bacterium]|nr:copper chaperone PCu(A)C [Anaerolineae bacterium]
EGQSVFTVKRILIVIFALTLLLSACTSEEGITVHNAWMRPTAQGENGAVYFVLHNNSGEADELVGASSSIAESVEIHESSMAEGTDVMQMNRAFSVPLDKGSEVAFEPGGLHVMLVNVSRELMVGETFEVTLHFKSHADLSVNVSVTEFAPIGDEHSH